jgi:potassium-transporting ATPase ATP-binding subunit
MRHGKRERQALTTWEMICGATPLAFQKLLQVRRLLQNPTMSVVFFVNLLLTLFLIYEWMNGSQLLGFHALTLFCLWLTSLFANFSEAVAEGRGKAQAASLRALQTETTAKRLFNAKDKEHYEELPASELQVDDVVLVAKGDIVPCDGEVIEGVSLVDESAVTGESAPVVREAGGDVSALTGGTVILSDWVVMRVTARSGEGFLEKMIQLVEGAKRRKTPNEEALHIVLTGFTLIFLIVVATLNPLFHCESSFLGLGLLLDPFVIVSLLVCLIPTTIGGLLPAIGIAGIDRMVRHNMLALTPSAVEAAGDVDTLLLDKTGTITLGNRQAAEFFPAPSISVDELAQAALIASISDDTAEGKSIVKLARETYNCKETYDSAAWSFIPFTAKTRMSGVDAQIGAFRKGALDAIEGMLHRSGGTVPKEVVDQVNAISTRGGTPLVVTKNNVVLGSIFLKDIIKPGLKERFVQLRKMGIRTVMITGDNQLTAVAIAAEAGVDECFGQVTPEDKLRIIERFQSEGHLVAMTGDGTNDAPALAKADVAMAMNSGTQAAREAANMVDLDSDPTKLIEAVGIGKQLLMTRGALTTFSIANDVAKYFVMIPVVFLPICPQLNIFNIMNLYSGATAILSCVIFNAFIILGLVPLALKGVRYEAVDAHRLFCRNLWIWGSGGVFVPFVGIKAIDMIVSCFA